MLTHPTTVHRHLDGAEEATEGVNVSETVGLQPPPPPTVGTSNSNSTFGWRPRRPRRVTFDASTTTTNMEATTPVTAQNNTDIDDVVETTTTATATAITDIRTTQITTNRPSAAAAAAAASINRTTTTTTTTTSTSSSSPLPSTHSSSPWTSTTAWKVSRYYCWMSAIGALCAILVAAPTSTGSTKHHPDISINSNNNNNNNMIPQHSKLALTSTSLAATTSTVTSNMNTCSSSSTAGITSTIATGTNILSNALSSLTTTTTATATATATAPNNLKSNKDPNQDHQICTSSSSAPALASSDRQVMTVATTTTTGTTPHETTHDDATGWFRWRTVVPSTTTTTTLPSKRPVVPPTHDPPKNFIQSLVDTITMKKEHPTQNGNNAAPAAGGSNDSSDLKKKKKNKTTKNHRRQTTAPLSSSMVSSILQVLLFSWLDPNLTFTLAAATNRGSSGSSHPSSFPFDTIITNLIDKVLTSTVRLILIANWLIALTVLLHTAVADYFLGNRSHTSSGSSNNNNNNNSREGQRQNSTHHSNDNTTTTTTNTGTPDHHRTTGNTAMIMSNPTVASRERMGGYLLFKFLLISALVGPDTFDLLILLSWYTVLSFLRSLASLCIQQIDTCRLLLHSVPQVGVLQLLCTVLCLDVMAAMTCIGLFHGAGYGMVILLTCDCVLLAFDTISHIVQYYQSILDVQHANHIQTIDDQQMALHYQLLQQRRRQQQQQDAEQQSSTLAVMLTASAMIDTTTTTSEPVSTTNPLNDVSNDDIEERSKDLDRQLDVYEQQHSRTSARIETMIFVLQVMIDIVTILHFLHIWTLHGIHFTFIDGVIALHLHSSATSAMKKVHDRRATHRIARDMDELFHNATEHDLQNASIAGDVCCICLGTMYYFPTKIATTGSRSKDHTQQQQQQCHRSPTCNVKKVACGHLYHTTCLREVIERARSIEAARCPLCRAPFVPPKPQPPWNTSTRVVDRRAASPRVNPTTVRAINETHQRDAAQEIVHGERILDPRPEDATTPINDNGPSDFPDSDGGGRATSPIAVVNAEDSIFRFTTEGLLPDWIPLPGFSFEIVRRAPSSSSPTNAATIRDGTANAVEPAVGEPPLPEVDRPNPPLPPPPPPAEQSLFRRFLLLTGIVQMSPEEEAMALEQLSDMFPQYDRHDLQRALRQRGTIDAVVESILLGLFVGRSTEGGER